MAFEFLRQDLGRVGSRVLVATLLATTVLAAGSTMVSTRGFAQSGAEAVFDIPAGPLGRALAAFGRQAGAQVTYEAAIAAGKTSPGLRGAATREQAIARILQGSGLVYQFTDPSSVLILDQIAAAQTAPVGADGLLVLDTITVSGGNDRAAASGAGFMGTPDWVYQTPGSVSVVSGEAIKSQSTRSGRELLAKTPGVLVSGDNNQNQGLNVNIRGLQDQGRVNMMIDGARQNFQRSGHGSTGYTYVDPALVRSVEVEKDGTSGVGGAGVLAGSVNFRTLLADDLIRAGKSWGAEFDLTRGTNEYTFAGSGSAAVRISDGFALVGGISRKRLGEYAIGKNGDLGPVWELEDTERPIFTGSQTTSGLLKAEMRPTDDTTLDLSWLRYMSRFSQGVDEATSDGSLREDEQDVTNDTLTAAFGWRPDGAWVDLKARLWFNRTKNDEQKAKRTDYVQEADVSYVMESLGGSIENTSRFAVPLGALALTYGTEAFRDDGTTTATGPGIAADPLMALWYAGATPSGQRDVASGFANASLEHDDWLTLSGGLRYDWYRLSGTSTVIGEAIQVYHEPQNCIRYYSDGVRCRVWGTPGYYSTEYPTQETNVDLSDGALLPSAKIAVKPWDGVQLFGGYSQAFRPPTIMEAFLTGSHVGTIGPAYAPNPSLAAESGRTYEIGLNYSKDGIFSTGDRLRGKIVGFHRQIKDYIGMGQTGVGDLDYVSYVNLDGTTRMTGVEVEANYDAGSYYIGGAFSYIDAKYASTFTYEGTSRTTEQYIIFTVPKMTVSLDAGLRLFEQKLTLGGRVTHVEPEAQETGTYPSLLSSYASEGYTTLDLYGSYALNENAKLRFAVNNVTDEAYVPVLGSKTLPAPGRTATLSLNLKF